MQQERVNTRRRVHEKSRINRLSDCKVCSSVSRRQEGLAKPNSSSKLFRTFLTCGGWNKDSINPHQGDCRRAQNPRAQGRGNAKSAPRERLPRAPGRLFRGLLGGEECADRFCPMGDLITATVFFGCTPLPRVKLNRPPVDYPRLTFTFPRWADIALLKCDGGLRNC